MIPRKQLDPALPLPWYSACILVILVIFSSTASALNVVPGSPCESVCSSAIIGTIEDDTVCLDDDYTNSQIGKDFRRCVACGLNSTAVDTADNTTDVEYALFDLRFALSTCMFAYPIERVSISSPCQVTCAPLSAAIGAGLSNNSASTSPSLGFCTAGQFDDTTINKCAFCYGLIPQQLFLANFLQALHVACRDPPIAGEPFFPDAISIFNESVIAGPSAATTVSTTSSGLHGWKLALAIALPVVGFLALLLLSCYGCFVFTRRRRQHMAESGRMSRVHNSFAHTSGSAGYSDIDAYQPGDPSMSGGAGWIGQREPMHEMEHISPQQQQRYSQHQHTAEGDGEGTPLHDEVGPGDDQVQDHNLHDQFFGVPEGEVGQAVPMTPIQGVRGSQQQQQEHYSPVEQQYEYPPPQQRQQQQQHHPPQQKQYEYSPPQQREEIRPTSAASPRSQAGPSYAERMSQQQERQDYDGHDHARDTRGEWI